MTDQGPKAASFLISLPYRGPNLPFTYMDVTGKQDIAAAIPAKKTLFLDSDEFLMHRLLAGPSGGVARCEINGRKGRRAICVVAEDLIRYQIFDIDTAEVLEDINSDTMAE